MAKNRIKIGLPLYGSVTALYFQEWLRWQQEVARVVGENYAGIITTTQPYLDSAENTIVDQSLRCTCTHPWSMHMIQGVCGYYERLEDSKPCPCQKLVPAEKWDYLVMVESDNILPEGWIEKVINSYDKPVVGLMYFGKVEEDQRPIPGYLRDGQYTRLEFDEVSEWFKKPDFYEVDTVGMGATAIRRDVFETWNPWMMPWFQTKLSPPNQILGQDIYFCMAAKKQGFKIYVDTNFSAEHIGPWRSNLANYIAAHQWKDVRDVEMAKVLPPKANGSFPHGKESVEILVPPLD